MDYKELLKTLTIDEKVRLTSGNDMWHLLGIEKHNMLRQSSVGQMKLVL